MVKNAVQSAMPFNTLSKRSRVSKLSRLQRDYQAIEPVLAEVGSASCRSLLLPNLVVASSSCGCSGGATFAHHQLISCIIFRVLTIGEDKVVWKV